MGARLDLDALPPPEGVPLARWPLAFMSFGFLRAVPPETFAALAAPFLARGHVARAVGEITSGSEVVLTPGAGAGRPLGLGPRRLHRIPKAMNQPAKAWGTEQRFFLPNWRMRARSPRLVAPPPRACAPLVFVGGSGFLLPA